MQEMRAAMRIRRGETDLLCRSCHSLSLPSLLYAADLCHFGNTPQAANHLGQMMAVAYL